MQRKYDPISLILVVLKEMLYKNPNLETNLVTFYLTEEPYWGQCTIIKWVNWYKNLECQSDDAAYIIGRRK